MPEALITADNISLNHQGKDILDSVSFRLHQGEFITLIGPNGAGKSSLIKVLLGLINQDSGTVKYSKKYPSWLYPANILTESFYSDICN